jgi:maltose alpha-D-glucosyltransferase/alpha-amylase
MNDLSWPRILEPQQRTPLAESLLAYVRERRWFRAKARHPRQAHVADLIPLGSRQVLAVLQIDYDAGESELYVVPLGEVDRQAAQELAGAAAEGPVAIVSPLVAGGAIVDTLLIPGQAADTFLDLVRQGGSARGEMGGELRGEPMPQFEELAGVELPVATIPRAEQTNSTATFGDRVLLKIYRRLTAGTNPELEVGQFLTTHSDPPCAPRVLGALSYRSAAGETFSLGIVHEFLANAGDAFSFVLAELRAELEREGATSEPPSRMAASASAPPTASDLPRAGAEAGMEELLVRVFRPTEELDGHSAVAAAVGAVAAGEFSVLAATLGRRTGELHLALAGADAGMPDFAAEPLTAQDRARMVTRAEDMLGLQLDALSAAMPGLLPRARELAHRLLQPSARQAIADRLSQFRERAIDVVKTRTHGDLHLGQVLVIPGNDFVIIDFEGEPARPLVERRAKSSPLRDVMGMVRSFDYAPEVVLRDEGLAKAAPERRLRLQARAASWTRAATESYLRGYLATVQGAPFIPRERGELALLLTFFELEKVIYEIGYELNNRPTWVEIPLRGLAAIARIEGGS